jgi:quercetin dioxygenase-like cupin family protein
MAGLEVKHVSSPEGRMNVQMDDGTEQEIGPGDVAAIPPGHDAWTVGDEACVAVDWGGASNYAKG